MRIVFTVAAAIGVLSLAGCFDENKPSPPLSSSAPKTTQRAPEPAHPEDALALRLLSSPDLFGYVCDKLGDAKVIERIKGTASANNHPAYVVGYTFNCVSNYGNKPQTAYIGWMENVDTQQAQCIHHNQDRNRVVNEGWHSCGGNFRPL